VQQKHAHVHKQAACDHHPDVRHEGSEAIAVSHKTAASPSQICKAAQLAQTPNLCAHVCMQTQIGTQSSFQTQANYTGKDKINAAKVSTACHVTQAVPLLRYLCWHLLHGASNRCYVMLHKAQPHKGTTAQVRAVEPKA
jgi:hypothetical protein